MSPLTAPRRSRRETPTSWDGSMRHYDILKEGAIAVSVAILLTVLLAALFSSPDTPQISIAGWAKADPLDFVTTAAMELDGTSMSATYGPPYNNASTGQKLGPLQLARWAGVRQRIDPAKDFVLNPLATVAPEQPALASALRTYEAASSSQQKAWASAYDEALAKGHMVGTLPKVAAGDYGPVPAILASELNLARSGALDADLLAGRSFYGTDYTKPLLFLADGQYFFQVAKADHFQSNQWGMMNETGSYPGQAWLWLYTMWYQVPPMYSSGNADALVIGIMIVLSGALMLIPFIPGLRDIPRWVPIYRLIWRQHYRAMEGSDEAS